MATELRIPKIGVEMQSAVIDQWNIEEGNQVEKGDIILTIQTEKVTYEIDSPASGFVKVIGHEGEEYDVGVVVATIAETRDEYESINNEQSEHKDDDKNVEKQLNEVQEQKTLKPELTACNGDAVEKNRKVKSTPLAKKIARENGIDLTMVTGSGPSGAIVKRDVLQAIENKEQNTTVEAVTTEEPDSSQPDNKQHGLKQIAERKPLKGMRKNIAKHMVSSLQTAAQLTDINEVNVSKLVQFRKELNDDIAEHLGYKISFNHLIIKAVSIILKELPVFNSSINDKEIIQWKNINIGCAVAIDDGLVVPVIKNVDQLSLHEIANEFTRLVDKARNGSLTTDDVSGGTFTITNVGSYGGYYATPILNQPEVAILGVGQIKEKPIVNENREIIVGDMMGYNLTFDHRLIDGATAGEFLQAFIQIIENPKLLLIK
ncbi:dihydrolipoamide acetyltransferase family protein [Desertibacillus haloalkaliphilus]|uniref:dihydrolipoamide acetyltransferase family protein n=1 Tax=Desertibacillus haloalkaliphilus TaxID=1328930 RepID=UPI001C25DD87|nr:dihydrolipoamide acetyltransferase family protein [Desertibacillus haloalkaliphilus]MBU8906124.1 2-oxo acid dehydrogenase subunit E2 [Desertibacillus haloalkaliphilus]